MEITFERGGTLPRKVSNLKKKEKHFGVENVEKVKSKDKSSKAQKKPKDDEEIHSANILSIHSLVNDMLVMGIIKAVHATHLYVSLPGKLSGRVPITNISQTYTKVLQSMVDAEDLINKPKSLQEMFTPGQVVCTKVMSKCHGEKNEILLSLIPEDVNSEISPGLLEESGNVLVCAIEEKEDHGYILETGIKNIRGFLPKKNIKTEPSLGELLYCKVQKTTSSVITFTTFKKHEPIKIDTAEVPNLKSLVPGVFVDFTAVRILKNGVEGLLFDGSVTGYCNELYTPSKMALTSDLIGKKLSARILYTMPLSNHLYVTLNNKEIKTKRSLSFGTLIENAKVVKQTTSGILFKINENDKAFLPRKTIVGNLKLNFDIDTALAKFSPNSTHTIRVLDFNLFENCYLCTNNEKLLREKYFSTYDMSIGDVVTGKIEEELNDGLRLSIGNVRAYLKNFFYHKITKVTLGNEIKVRVAEVDHDAKLVQVTNMPGFLKENCPILASQDAIKVGNHYCGVVINDAPKHFTVLFFNHLKGFLKKTPSIESELISIGGLKAGSVKIFEIASIKGDYISLRVPRKIDTQHLGEIFDCKISAILPSSIQIFISKLKTYGKIPMELLSENVAFNEHMLQMFKENQTLEVVCFGNNQYSKRDVKYFKNPETIIDFKDVKPNDILRCYVKSINDESVELECPLKNFKDTIRLNKNAFDNPSEITLDVGSIVYVSVIAKNESRTNSLFVSPELHKVWKSNEEAMELLENYLDDVSFLIESMKKAGKSFANYSIGQRVSGSIKNIIGNNLLIEIEEGIFAQSTVDNVGINKIGQKIEDAVVVWMDPVQQMLFVTTQSKVKEEISIDQHIDDDMVNEKKHKGIVVYFNNHVTVCTLRKSSQPLIYVPTKQHYNDFTPQNNRALGNATSKLTIKKAAGGKLIGMFVQDSRVYQKLEKFKNKLEVKVLKRQASDSELNKDAKKKIKVELDESDIEESVEEKPKAFKKAKTNTLKKKLKNTIKRSKGSSKNFLKNNTIIDEDIVNLTSYKKLNTEGEPTISVGQKHQKSLKKSTIGRKKKVKRLIKK